jgi:hypothetical protein
MSTEAAGNGTPTKIVEGIPSGNILEIVPKHEDRESDLLGAGAPETLRHIQDNVRDTSEQVIGPDEESAIGR